MVACMWLLAYCEQQPPSLYCAMSERSVFITADICVVFEKKVEHLAYEPCLIEAPCMQGGSSRMQGGHNLMRGHRHVGGHGRRTRGGHFTERATTSSTVSSDSPSL